VPDVLGAPGRPFTDDMLIDKFRDQAARVMPQSTVDALVDEVLFREGGPSPEALGRCLRTAQSRLPENARLMESA
jgi:hypothetical protein